MERILIIGGNGAGKSTFSYALAKKLGLPLIHLDQIYWHGCWEVTPREEFLEKVMEEAQKDRWIIDGNNLVLNDIKGEIEFKNVSFKYPDADSYMLKDISFKIIAVVVIPFWVNAEKI